MTPSSIADAVWTYSTRTLDESSPGASNGSFLDDIGYHVWTYSTRTVEGQTMATLLSDVSANGAGTGAAITGACTVWASGEFDGAEVIIQGAATDTADDYAKLNASIASTHRIKGKSAIAINATGSYYLRAVVENAGPSTSITVVTT